MSFIRYKKFGNKEYAYEVNAYWDPKLKKPRQKSRYLGAVIDKKKKIIKRKVKKEDEKLILDFGDVYLLNEFMKKVKIHSLLNRVFGEKTKYLLAMICYRLCYPSAMSYAKIWNDGSIARILFNSKLSSQRISDFLRDIGDENVQRDFFKTHISSFVKSKNGVIIDTTSLPNQIHFPFNAWGRCDVGIDKQIRFLFVVDKDCSLPIFFRYLPGNVVDVSSLSATIGELRNLGISNNFVLTDAGFYSEENIKGLFDDGIDFLTRLPSSRKLYKTLVREEVADIEKFKHAAGYGKRALFVKQKKIQLFGKDAYAHIILDPETKGHKIKRLLLEELEEKSRDDDEIQFKMMKCGIMILISSFKIEKEELLPFYYMRQAAEQLFGFSKDDLKLIPLRVHGEETLRGYLLLTFITLIVFAMFRKKLGKKYTVEEILLTMRSLKCKVYDKEIIVQEVTKQQREITEELDIIMPKNLGI